MGRSKKYAPALIRCCDNCGALIPGRFQWLEAVIEICRECVDNAYLDFTGIDLRWYWDIERLDA